MCILLVAGWRDERTNTDLSTEMLRGNKTSLDAAGNVWSRLKTDLDGE